ncbi:MAG: hypothetical protein IPK83_24855 [Planctomycetes bacterium]|nr:hypothetical protein [Planctomycetota bacterium]
MAIITDEQVTAAYAALATGQRDRIAEIWAEDLRWLVPGQTSSRVGRTTWTNSSRSWPRSADCRTTASAWIGWR